MGYRLYVAERYDVKFIGGDFNNLYDEFTDYLVTEVDSSLDCTNYPETIELYLQTVKDHIKFLRSKSDSELDMFAFAHITYRDLLSFWRNAVMVTERDGRDFVLIEWQY